MEKGFHYHHPSPYLVIYLNIKLRIYPSFFSLFPLAIRIILFILLASTAAVNVMYELLEKYILKDLKFMRM